MTGFILSCGCNCIDENTTVPCFSDKCVYDKQRVLELFLAQKDTEEQIKEFEKDRMNEINPWIN